MSLTRLQISDLTRANLGELDSKKIEQGLLNTYINFAQRKVQQDLMSILGMKTFTKEGVLYGSTPNIPSDLLMINDSIIKIKSGIGVKASGTLTVDAETPNEYKITITALNAGSIWNYGLALVDEQATTSVTLVGTTFNLAFDLSAGTITTQDLVTALNASSAFNTYFIASTTTPNVKPVTVGSLTLTTGTNPTTYYPCEESTIEEFIDKTGDTFSAPTATSPQFIRRGDTSANQIIEFLPNTINYSVIYYKYKLPDLTADSSILSLAGEYEELVIEKLMVKCYEILKASAENQTKQIEYANKIKEYDESYIRNRNAITGEKTRIENTNTNK